MQDVDVVFHLASLVSITKDQEELVRKVNVDGTRNVIEAVRDARVRRLVYTSSIHALERPPIGTPVNEALKFDPENAAGVYDQTKAEASLLVKQAASEGLDAVILCPTGVTGPYDFRRSEVGELILSFMQKRITFLVEGAYDFVDVRDVATGQILARDYAKSGETYILGGERIELKLMHDLVKKVTGKDTKVLSFPLPVALIVAPIAELYYKVTKTRPRFTRYSIETVISNSEIYSDKAKAELGYKPRSLVNSIADTVRWWWENLGLTRKSLRL
jgi:dihydroflavonol-4-reductase